MTIVVHHIITWLSSSIATWHDNHSPLHHGMNIVVHRIMTRLTIIVHHIMTIIVNRSMTWHNLNHITIWLSSSIASWLSSSTALWHVHHRPSLHNMTIIVHHIMTRLSSSIASWHDYHRLSLSITSWLSLPIVAWPDITKKKIHTHCCSGWIVGSSRGNNDSDHQGGIKLIFKCLKEKKKYNVMNTN